MNMPDSSDIENLKSLLPEVSYWRILADGRFEATPVDCYKMTQTHVVMTQEQLASYHPLLPEIVRLSVHYAIREGQFAQATGMCVDSTLALLQNNFVAVPGGTGADYYITFACKIEVSDKDPENVSITGYRALTEHVHINGQEVLLVVKTRPAIYPVCRAELAARYPGWEKRMEIGTDMGLKYKELLTYIFKQHQQPALDHTFTDVTFS